MLVDEEDPAQAVPCGHAALNFGLTNTATHLIWNGNDALVSHGNYDYQAHAYVYPGGAGPLESQGDAIEVSVLTSSKKRPAQRKAGGRFYLWGGNFRMAELRSPSVSAASAEGVDMTTAALKKIEAVQAGAEGWSAEEVVRWGLTEFHPQAAIASSFGAEDVALIDIAARLRTDIRVFTLDTDFLFAETYELIAKIEQKYGIRVERVKSLYTPEAQAAKFGAKLWTIDPNQCCSLRKVEPLKTKLASLDAWITGIRRDQAPTRANAKKIEWDNSFGLVKMNPLADWTWEKTWEYIREHDVPYNPLHEQNYPSIGCVQCTRQVQPGEDPRAGRWSGFAKKECGLHARE